jgi:rod shape-determining protein MreC
MKYVANDDTVAIGEHVVTSGMDRIFPRDLPVGTVAQIKDGNPFKQIRLKPAANLESLEDVIVLLSLQPLDLTKSDSKEASSAGGNVAETAKKEPERASKTAKP